MSPLLQMHVALLALSSRFVTAWQDGKFTAFFLYFELYFIIDLFYFIFYCDCFGNSNCLFLRFNFNFL